MRRHLVACACLAASLIAYAHDASAADIAVKAMPEEAAAATFGWTGFYFGGNLGYSFGTSDIATNTVTTLGGVATSQSERLQGVIGGVQTGYDLQAANGWLFGLETDWQGSAEKGSSNAVDPFNLGAAFGTLTTNYDTKIPWLGTLRGRIGYASDHLLFYTTGGLGYGETKVSGNVTMAGFSLGGPFNATTNFSHTRIGAGWTLGAGIEGAAIGDWSWKLEYLYVDLGSDNISFFGPLTAEATNVRARFTDNIIRIGINYRLR